MVGDQLREPDLRHNRNMKPIKRYTAITVRTTDGRYRHAIVTAVVSQTQVTARIGLVGFGKTVTANRVASTKTRGKEWVQA